MTKPIKFKSNGGYDLTSALYRQDMFALREAVEGWVVRGEPISSETLSAWDKRDTYEFKLCRWAVDQEGNGPAFDALLAISDWFEIMNGPRRVIRIEEFVGLPKEEIAVKYRTYKQEYGNVTVEGREHWINTEDDGPKRNEQEDWD